MTDDRYLARVEALHRQEPTTGFILVSLTAEGVPVCEVTVEPPITQFAALIVDLPDQS